MSHLARLNGEVNRDFRTLRASSWQTEILAEAGALPAKCPHWYEVAQEIALADGAHQDQQKAIFEKATAFEPLYFAYYQWYATALLPKWGGEPGELQAFAEEAYRQVGGKEGAHIYFEIASNLCGKCGDFSPDAFSWQKLQEGFAALEEPTLQPIALRSARASRPSWVPARRAERCLCGLRGPLPIT